MTDETINYESDLIRISGGSAKKSLKHARLEIDEGFPIKDQRFKDHVFSVIGELTYNAAQHGISAPNWGHWRIGADKLGTFVEVSSFSDGPKAQHVVAFLDEHRALDEDEIKKRSKAAYLHSIENDLDGGLGLYHIVRSCIRSEITGDRMVSATTRPNPDGVGVELTIRAYVSKQVGNLKRVRRN